VFFGLGDPFAAAAEFELAVPDLGEGTYVHGRRAAEVGDA
jgi:hypothetical protein